MHLNFPSGKDGPIATDENGDLSEPILRCQYGEHRCKFLGWHDYHYPYCSAQPSQNNDGSDPERSYAYPWPNAGTHIYNNKPNRDCPYNKAAD